MERIVSVKLTYTPDDSFRVAKYIRNQSFIYRNDVWLTSGFVFIAFIVLIALMTDDISELRILGATVFSAVPAILVGVAVFVLHRLVQPWFMRRAIANLFRSVPTASEEKKVTFSDEGISTESDLMSNHVKWPTIGRITESASDILMFNGKMLSGFLPKTSLTAEELDIIRELSRRNLGENAKFD
ncbi:MAG: YcxB family protein [Pyrinomonadaceae bacterium]